MTDAVTNVLGQRRDHGRVVQVEPVLETGSSKTVHKVGLALLNAHVEVSAELRIGFIEVLACQNAAA